MSIIVDLQLYDDDLGGGKTFIDSLLPLVFQDNPNIQFKLIGPKTVKNRFSETCSNVEMVLTTPSRSFLGRALVSLYLACYSFFRRDNVYWGPLNFIGFLPNFFTKTVVTIHDVMSLDCPEYYSPLELVFRRWQLRCALAFSSHIVSVSQFTDSRVKFYCTASEKEFYVSYESYAPLNMVSEQPETYISGKFLLFLGVGRKNKNLEFLVRSFDILVEKTGYEGQLVIAGKVPQRELDILIDVSKFPTRIVFPGYVSDTTLVSLYKNSDAFLFPSVYEGFGLPPIEALFYGAKLVLSDIPVFVELYSNVATLSAISAPTIFANAICSSLESNEPIDLSGFWDEFSWQKSSNFYISILNEASLTKSG